MNVKAQQTKDALPLLNNFFVLLCFNMNTLLLGGFLLGRTLVSVMTITLSTSMAARLGPLALAAHQICLQVWLSVSLLFDAQAASGQVINNLKSCYLSFSI